MYINNPIGDDIAEVQEKNTGSRVGRRMRVIREEHVPKMSQKDLGEAVGLNANRIQQYENGARTPRIDLLKKIAAALGVETTALADPDTSSFIGVMYALFEMENLFGLHLTEMDGTIYLSFQNSSDPVEEKRYVIKQINENLKAWFARQRERDEEIKSAHTKEDRQRINHEYHIWEWTFPKALADKNKRNLDKIRIQKQIEELQKQLHQIENSDD